MDKKTYERIEFHPIIEVIQAARNVFDCRRMSDRKKQLLPQANFHHCMIHKAEDGGEFSAIRESCLHLCIHYFKIFSRRYLSIFSLTTSNRQIYIERVIINYVHVQV